MSAKEITAWILAIAAILLALATLYLLQQGDATPAAVASGIAAIAVLGGGLLFVLIRDSFGEWSRLALAAGALVLSLALVCPGVLYGTRNIPCRLTVASLSPIAR
jgi:peptidoglycan/LPS O-acetylase OafA/YrhL